MIHSVACVGVAGTCCDVRVYGSIVHVSITWCGSCLQVLPTRKHIPRWSHANTALLSLNDLLNGLQHCYASRLPRVVGTAAGHRPLPCTMRSSSGHRIWLRCDDLPYIACLVMRRELKAYCIGYASLLTCSLIKQARDSHDLQVKRLAQTATMLIHANAMPCFFMHEVRGILS
jgi:hypothetical protein